MYGSFPQPPLSNLPSPYYLLPDVMRFGKKIFPNCSKGVRVVGRSEFTDDPILDLESTQLHTWVFSIYSIAIQCSFFGQTRAFSRPEY